MYYRENFESQQAEFLDYVDKWEKAMNSDVFKNAPQPATPSPQTAEFSFFGLVNSHPSELPSDIDAKYWNAIHQSGGDSELLQEEKHRNWPPNPVSVDTGGPDQKLSPEAFGNTFDEEDIKSLEEMKIKLYELENKIATAMGKGSSFKSFESQVTNLKRRIDDLSTKIGTSYHTDIA